MMINLFNTKAREIIKSKIISEHSKIKVKPGKCRFNFRCSYNTAHEALRGNHKKMTMVVYMSGDYPIIHFVNYKKGVFVDNTLGEWSAKYDFYFIRWIKKDEIWKVNNIFDDYREQLQNSLPLHVRLFNSEIF